MTKTMTLTRSEQEILEMFDNCEVVTSEEMESASPCGAHNERRGLRRKGYNISSAGHKKWVLDGGEYDVKHTSYIYLAKYYNSVSGEFLDLGCVKIGITNDLVSREKALSLTKGPVKVKFVEWLNSEEAEVLEKEIHKQLREHSLEGEWFNENETVMGAWECLKSKVLQQ